MPRKERDSESSRRRRRRRRSRSPSDSEEASDSSGSPRRSRSRNRRKSRRRDTHSSSDASDSQASDSGSDSGGRGRRRSGSRRKGEVTEEQIVEYMAKKAQKKAEKVAKKMKANAVSGYSNDSNPFGDPNLTEKFVWRKKIERDVSQGQKVDISVKGEKKKQRERMAEIEKVKKRREERAIEKAQHEEEMALLARERARAEFQDWEKKEEEFHFDQSKVRSEIRLREGRTKPIDVLLKNLNFSEEFDVELNEPYLVFKGLTVKEMEELRDDIKMHLDLDRESQINVKYWEALMVVCDWELGEARKRDALDRARVRGEEPPPDVLAEERGLHASIEGDVKDLLEGKTSTELEEMQSQIESQMRSGTAKTHYDHDNPPPKIVQGYKFNIFYPDLVDKSKAPTYTIEKDGSTGETCLIRFHAGPPYEDIAFRIVNKEWEYSHKKGFKCTFERGIIHLYFNFKRYRYRR
uniref:Splicing factor Cactin n=1 Tax=Oryza punctata TaxID=4537 RepID=A0A0E0KKA3_ORYPU